MNAVAKRKNRKFKPQPKVKASGKKIPKKYTKSSKSQQKKMADEIKKYKGTKGGKGTHQWTGDTNPKTGKRYKTKKSAATKAYERMYGKKKK